MVTNCLKSKFAPCSRLFLLPEKNQRTLFFFGKNGLPDFQTKGRQTVSLKKIPAQSIKKGRFAVKRLLITLARKIFLKTLKNRRSNV